MEGAHPIVTDEEILVVVDPYQADRIGQGEPGVSQSRPDADGSSAHGMCRFFARFGYAQTIPRGHSAGIPILIAADDYALEK